MISSPAANRLLEGPEWEALSAAAPSELAGIEALKNPARASESPVASRPRTINPTCFLNRAAVKAFLLHRARLERAHKFTRVRSDTLIEINETVRQHLVYLVHRLPSKGKTI
jgi:hypothetical protein